jgi:hypothetical protein
MLRCPKCNRSYQDDMQKFCTHDGGRLVPDFERPQVFDPNATVQGHLANLDIPVTPPAPRQPAEQPQNLNATIAGPLPSTPPPPQQAQPPHQAPPPQPVSPPPQQAQPRQPQEQPPPQPPVAPSSMPTLTSTNAFPPSGETKGLHQQTTRLSQPLPSLPTSAPPPRTDEPLRPEPPRQSPPSSAPQQFPTMMAPPTPPAPPPLPPTTGAPFQTGPMGGAQESHRETPTFDSQFSQQLRPQTAAQPSAPTTGPIQPASATGAPKKSKLGLVLAVGGVIVLLLLIGGGVGAYFIFIRNKMPKDDGGGVVAVDPTLNSNRNANVNPSPSPTQSVKAQEAPPGSIKFENSKETIDGKLADHYVDFYFYYPQSWQKSPKAGVPGAANFVEVERRLPPDLTQEDLAVSWYDSKGTVEADLAGRLPDLIKAQDANYAKSLPEYQKVSEGKTTVNGIEGYEFRFKAISQAADGSDLNIWGRVVYLPPGDETSTKGVTLYMLTTSLAPELQGLDDVGVKGELPMILNSFTLGKS